jgi:Mrp family chromosome partitioning ATPase
VANDSIVQETAVNARARMQLARVVATHHGPLAREARLPLVTAPTSESAASFRLLQYRLHRLGTARVIAVTSPNRSEGKTTCAMNLAMAFAEQGGNDVLLVEANLQFPNLGQQLGFTSPFCFAEQMRAANARPIGQWHAVAVFLPNLHVLAVDPARTESQLLNPTAFHAAMGQLRNSGYANIVIDCPPALGSADMNIVADHVDGILITCLAGRTRRASMRSTARNLEPATVLGTVLMNP